MFDIVAPKRRRDRKSGAGCRPVSGSRLEEQIAMIRMIQFGVLASLVAVTAASVPAAAQQQQQRPPNILVIMGDDVGWFNIGAYHRGIMSGKTPNLDKLA